MLKRRLLTGEERFDKPLGEKCGVTAVWSASGVAPFYVRKGQAALQHRGQESTGISVYTPKDGIQTFTGMGLIPHVLTSEVLQKLGDSKAAIGHNRYSTTGTSSLDNAQPITLSDGKYQISLGHNGNIPDICDLGERVKGNTDGISDTILTTKLILQERPKYKSWEETLVRVLAEVKGAFSFVILTSDGSIFGARDPYGIRPFCLGKFDDGWMLASESVALDLVGAEFMRDIEPGEIIKVDYEGKLSSYFFGKPKHPQHCLFEHIYFSRPDSFENGVRIRQGREASGRALGKRIMKKKIEADAVIPVFDSGYPAARGVAQALGLPIVDAITVSHYVGRTFIQPGQEKRVAAVNGKHNIVPDEVVGKRVIVVDDSAVRLTTSKRLNRGLKEAGAKEVYMVFASPPVVNHCDLGIDMKSKKELPASQWESEPIDKIEEHVAEYINADGVVYLPIDETARAMNGVKEDFYYFPFGGPHPIRGQQREFPKRIRKINPKAKIAVFISGSGTNLQEIIDRVNSGDINAKIVSVISNDKNAYGLKRAEINKIPTFVLPFEGKLGDREKRNEYEKKLLAHIKKTEADIIVLAGWMLVLGDEFLLGMQELEIPVLNLHPALLTKNLDDRIATSRGIIPVIRGAHAIKDAFERNLQVSGVTVHQLLPKNYFDSGPVILKEEVRRKKLDTLETFENRIHDAEYRTLPTAIKRVIHVMAEGIDVSKGQYPW